MTKVGTCDPRKLNNKPQNFEINAFQNILSRAISLEIQYKFISTLLPYGDRPVVENLS